MFPYRNVALAAAPFPKQFPFSGMVGQVYCQLESFVRNCNDYADRLNLRLAHYYSLVLVVSGCIVASAVHMYPQSNGSV